jgi:hypothetical protein
MFAGIKYPSAVDYPLRKGRAKMGMPVKNGDSMPCQIRRATWEMDERNGDGATG